MLSNAKKYVRALLLAFFAAAAPPALADTTAVYGSPRPGFSMTVEINDNGDLRGEIAGQPHYFIKRAGELFLIEKTEAGRRVTRFTDLKTAMLEQMPKLLPRMPSGAADGLPRMDLVPRGEVVVNGRRGKAYFDTSGEGELYPEPVVVISDDPALAELGKALAAQYAFSTLLIGEWLGQVPAFISQTQRILESGAPLRFANMELKSVSAAPIDPDRFTLPGLPETLDQVRERLRQQRL